MLKMLSEGYVLMDKKYNNSELIGIYRDKHKMMVKFRDLLAVKHKCSVANLIDYGIPVWFRDGYVIGYDSDDSFDENDTDGFGCNYIELKSIEDKFYDKGKYSYNNWSEIFYQISNIT